MMNGLNLSLVSHYINCDNCQNQVHCDIARMLITSISSSEGLASSEIPTQIQMNERISRSDPELTRRGRTLISESNSSRPSLRPEIDAGASAFDASIDNDVEKSNNQSS